MLDQYASLNTLLYLAPSLALALVLTRLSRYFTLFSFLMLSGTLVHELLHALIAALTGARPVSFSLWPRRDGQNRYVLGSVGFGNARWWNAAPAALAPILAVLPILWIAQSRSMYLTTPHELDFVLWAALAPQLMSCWPSTQDWRISLISWPLYLAGAAALIIRFFPGVFG